MAKRENKKSQGFRHGDVILIKGSIPDDAKKVPNRPLALGEVTGHAHRITTGDFKLYEKGGVLYCSVTSDTANLTHEEHGPITLPKGDYRVNIQREYEPERNRYVRD